MDTVLNTTNLAQHWAATYFLRHSDHQELVEDFHRAMGQPLYLDFDQATPELLDFRGQLIAEEVDEFFYAESQENALKEMADIMYVLYGAAATFGWDLDEAFRRVHLSNMSKLVDGKPLLREDGKVMKGPNYKPADLSDLVA